MISATQLVENLANGINHRVQLCGRYASGDCADGENCVNIHCITGVPSSNEQDVAKFVLTVRSLQQESLESLESQCAYIPSMRARTPARNEAIQKPKLIRSSVLVFKVVGLYAQERWIWQEERYSCLRSSRQALTMPIRLAGLHFISNRLVRKAVQVSWSKLEIQASLYVQLVAPPSWSFLRDLNR